MSTIKSLLAGCITLVLLGTVFFLPDSRAVILGTLLDQIRGEHWYRLELSSQLIGQYYSKTWINTNNQIVFTSTLTFTLPSAGTTQINESLTFSAHKPHVLLTGNYSEHSDNKLFREISLQQYNSDPSEPQNKRHLRSTGQTHSTQQSYNFVITSDQQSQKRQQRFTYTLEDHLGLELWLKQQQPKPKATLSTQYFDFNKLQPKSTTWHVISNKSSGYIISNDITGDNLYVLDKKFLPISFSLDSLFKLYRITREPTQITAKTHLLHTSNLHVPVTHALGDPTTISSLRIEIDAISANVLKNNPSQTIYQNQGVHILKTQQRELPPSTAPTRSESLLNSQAAKHPSAVDTRLEMLAESTLYPINHPQINKLASTLSLANKSDKAKLQALLKFVNTYLEYKETKYPLTLIKAIQSQSGDCTEFADLLTTLARHFGLPARSITGLAYSDTPTPGFYVHAWNQIMIGGHWQSVDPTWNEMQIDATHIAFPTNSIDQLKAFATIPFMRFNIKNIIRSGTDNF
ncbi:MAG: transglutaminase-like domain-containing protein [Pseudomonadales bacterium]|nr:transglutaminase-like domain-containing protein [Pseudomonadales bacterium]